MNRGMPGTVGSAQAEAGRRLGGPLAQRWTPALLAERLGPPLAGSVLPFVLVLYLALKGGGYDEIVYGEVGVAVWWIVLLGAAVGGLPRGPGPRARWARLGALGA